jgi:hypothetical protein
MEDNIDIGESRGEERRGEERKPKRKEVDD